MTDIPSELVEKIAEAFVSEVPLSNRTKARLKQSNDLAQIAAECASEFYRKELNKLRLEKIAEFGQWQDAHETIVSQQKRIEELEGRLKISYCCYECRSGDCDDCSVWVEYMCEHSDGDGNHQ